MVLVEGLTEFAAASYATDTALLAELRATWPPSSGIDAAPAGYRPTDLESLDVVAAVRLTDRFEVVVATDSAVDDG
jgi:hypothetical protein